MDPSAQSGPPYPQHPSYRPPSPYPPPPRPESVNGLAITSLVVGVVCCLPPLGLVLGAVALGQISRKGGRGKGMAIAGIVLSSISTLLVLLMVVTGAAGDAWNGFRDGVEGASRSKSTQNLRKGECFDVPGGDLEREVVNVDIVPCDERHDAEVTGTYRFKRSDPAPGSPAGETFAEDRCLDLNDAYVPDSWAFPDDVEMYYYLPTRQGWARGDRAVTCALTGDGLTRSLRVGPGTHDPDQLSYINAEHAVESAAYEEPDADFSDDPAPYRSWAKEMATVLAEQATALRGRSWPEGASPSLTARAKQFEASGKAWAVAAKAADEDAFWAHVTAAEWALTTETRIAARDALGLSTTPPPDEEYATGA
ncbi:DUF4190 domain-containing protein [Streptomyces pristinaespiralis]|uniref:Uncharacterized protein n=1 Tax=Streptomyces pristinaespiralis TaxID=38300 RepID=A0A0M3QI91_STRPR|nr:DUF4190 domain-containing protein [Streptomyces pristinaespiralis]ALC21089.1 hypothetical protein SPRI_2783 [Streptomyces pristinaespiralis]QMU16146.1 DUF4190 domain-containing protein [Streptomyces pristinaespiralis]